MALMHNVKIDINFQYFVSDNCTKTLNELEDKIRELLDDITNESYTINVNCEYIEE
jgi:hypothetical protein